MARKRPKTPNATMAEVCRWIKAGVFYVEHGEVYKGDYKLAQRINQRRGSEHGDPRVDLWHDSKRRSCHVSQLAWMQQTRRPIPRGFEIHHFDQNPLNNEPENLFCCHPLDHQKIHAVEPAEAVPF